jgi:D-alanyl-D-alanine carboxypeptidase
MYYYPAAESGATEVKIPKDAEYTISGNNIGGFIVTVTVK